MHDAQETRKQRGDNYPAQRWALGSTDISWPGRHRQTQTRLHFQEPKTEKFRRSVAMSDICLAALRRHKAQQAEEKLLLGPGYQDHGLVFAQAGGRPIDTRLMNLYFTQALRRAGVPAVRLYDARHTFATWMLEQGTQPKVVSEMLGHSKINTTLDVYGHVSLELQQQATAKPNAALTGGRWLLGCRQGCRQSWFYE
jgi:integrase